MASSGPPTGNSAYRFTGYHKFLDPEGYPAVAPPRGALNAIDLNTRRVRTEDTPRRISRARRQGNEEDSAQKTMVVRSLLLVA
jgi:hypothetical protein